MISQYLETIIENENDIISLKMLEDMYEKYKHLIKDGDKNNIYIELFKQSEENVDYSKVVLKAYIK